ncbi:MAG: DUF2911 domain-containing protein [Saprospiraceae bacterium]|nr:DUF2911 domain-containing protein [Saprospiraceae bacterium]
MKKALVTICLSALCMLMVSMSHAQVTTPAPSPWSKTEQMVGLTKVTVEYSRPSMKGRSIFGGLVPYDKAWRTGANSATKITFDKDVQVGGNDVKAGSYAVITKPGMDSWKVMFYPYAGGSWGSYLSSDVEPVTVTGETASMGDIKVESFEISFNDLTNDGANLYMFWDNTAVWVPIAVHTDKEVMASIDKTMAGPSAGDYYGAANYLAAKGEDLEKALKWMNKSIDMGNKRFWTLRAKSLLQAKMGDKAGAVETAKESLEMAKEAGNDDYIKMNTESIKEWSM